MFCFVLSLSLFRGHAALFYPALIGHSRFVAPKQKLHQQHPGTIKYIDAYGYFSSHLRERPHGVENQTSHQRRAVHKQNEKIQNEKKLWNFFPVPGIEKPLLKCLPFFLALVFSGYSLIPNRNPRIIQNAIRKDARTQNSWLLRLMFYLPLPVVAPS